MRRLIVVVPAILGGFTGWQPLVDRLNAEPELEGSHWLTWDHEIKWYSAGDPMALANDLRARIDQECAARGPFEDVILVGHSLGGLLIRQAYLLAAGADHVTRQTSEWSGLVSRIILFAAVNRGVDPDRTRQFRLATWLGRVFPPMRRLLSWHLFRGSEFITNLRIQWIRHFARMGESAPTVVQLLGTKDELVTREDSVDVEQFRTAFYISIPDATHGDLHRLDMAPDADGRYALIRDAFINRKPLHGENVEITGPGQVVFVLHGIRADNRTWVQQTIKAIKDRWPSVEAIGPRYPYFSALKFAIPMTRRKNLRWFQDAYTEALARNPHARFSFIGHSNGTYLFGESLRTIPGMQFERAALVGSVLPVDYDWNACARREQINELRVDGSSFDWPVGLLCSALSGAGMKDVGTGGFDGFMTGALPTHEFFWYAGGHSAPLVETNLSALAEYAVTGNVVRPQQLGRQHKPFAIASRAARRISPLLVIAAVAALVYLAYVNPLAALATVGALLLVVFILDVI